MDTIARPLTNAQLEILKTFSHDLSADDLLALRKTLAHFFAERAVQLANAAWDEKGWTDEDVDRILQTKMRKRSK